MAVKRRKLQRRKNRIQFSCSNFIVLVTVEELAYLLAEARVPVTFDIRVAGVAVVKAEDRALGHSWDNIRAVSLSRSNGHSVELRHG